MRRLEGIEITVAAATAVVASVGIVYFWKTMVTLDNQADANAALSFSDREIAGGNSLVVDQEAAYEALGAIPATETYRVITGDGLRNATPLTLAFVDGWFRYFLMPRRPSPTARWIVCYGCETAGLGGRYVFRWRDENGISIGRLR